MGYQTDPMHALEIPAADKKILIVEDELVFAKAVKKHLRRAGYDSEIADSLEHARGKCDAFTPDLVLLDMRLPDGSGLDFLDALSKRRDASAVIVMSAYGELEDAVSAMKLGASDYLKKPVDLDELLLNVEKVFDKAELEKKLTRSNKREHNAREAVELIGDCSAIRAVKQKIQQIGQLVDASRVIPPTVLILGETGTGKDVVARSLHANTALRTKPFVQVDCASLPKDLIEAELFGHEKGAFTNAHIARTGLIEAAEDGVLFMDEIGELSLDLQSKLLAVIERRHMRKVGATKELPVQAWFIVATNRPLAALVEQGEFRADLYYRLNVLSIEMPPLKVRGDDILNLAGYFAEQAGRRYGLNRVIFSHDAEQTMIAYPWPGNVREMKHVIERAILLNGGGEISSSALGLEAQSLPQKTAATGDSGEGETKTLGSAELELIKQALERANGNVSKAARALNITRMALRYRIQKYNLDRVKSGR